MGDLNKNTSYIQKNIDWIISKIKGHGIKVDLDAPTYPWHDLIGVITPDGDHPSRSPTKEIFISGAGGDIYGYEYTTGNEVDAVFHIPHDWLPSHDALIHMHWSHNHLTPTGAITLEMYASYASRDGAVVFQPPIKLADISIPDVSIIPAHKHIVTEVALTGDILVDSDILDRDLIEVDGVIMLSVKVIDDTDQNGFFIITGDIHYQSTGIGTKNNIHPFYG